MPSQRVFPFSLAVFCISPLWTVHLCGQPPLTAFGTFQLGAMVSLNENMTIFSLLKPECPFLGHQPAICSPAQNSCFPSSSTRPSEHPLAFHMAMSPGLWNQQARASQKSGEKGRKLMIWPREHTLFIVCWIPRIVLTRAQGKHRLDTHNR